MNEAGGLHDLRTVQLLLPDHDAQPAHAIVDRGKDLKPGGGSRQEQTAIRGRPGPTPCNSRRYLSSSNHSLACSTCIKSRAASRISLFRSSSMSSASISSSSP